MYIIIYSEKSLKQLKKLEKNVQQRITSTLERIRIRPEAYLKKLVDDPGWSLPVGDYRIIADLDQGRLVVIVIKLGHRKNIYER
jgi:mRNA interferase RelE/StbE